MERKTKTIELQGKEYAQVKDRIKEFRTDNPRGLIETTPSFQDNGQILFKARILKDKSDENSAESNGYALGESKGTKAFEKLETIAVGRALAFLGYSSDGEIASSEEMEEFEDFQADKKINELLMMQFLLESSTTENELRENWGKLSAFGKSELNDLKDELKLKLSQPSEITDIEPIYEDS